MKNKNNEEIIEIRRCDLHAVFALMVMGNDKLVEAAWRSIELLLENAKKRRR